MKRMTLAVLATLVAAAALAAAQTPADQQEPKPAPKPEQGPTFRTGIELVMVDVGVSDERGRPVSDLLAPDFVVKIDGDVRRVVSAEHVRIDVEAAKKQAKEDAETESFFTSNLTPPNGRMIVIAVDQSNIRPGAARPLLASAAKFLALLSPADKVAFIAYPQPGVAVDFTTDHAKIRNAMGRVTGVQSRHRGRFNIGVWEAKAIVDNHDEITRRTVVMRECAMMQGADLERCERDVELEAGDMITAQRLDTSMALRGLQDLLTDLALVEGPKNMILLSEGLILDGVGGELDEIVRLAAMGRVSINVLLMDVPRFEVTQSQLPPSAGEDRELQVQGLENLAGLSRGALFRVIGTGDAIFERLASEMSAYYLLGVEQTARDRDGKRHRIDVEVRRRNVTVRSRRAFVLSAATGGRATPQDRLVSALKTPFAVAEVPLRLTSYSYQDSDSEKVRVVLAADVGQPGASAAEYTIGYVLIDDQGNVASSGQEKRKLEPLDTGGNAPLGFIAGMVVDPGNYHVRFGVVDGEGRRGSIIRDVRAWKTAGEELAVGDLMVGGLAGNQPLRPQVEPRVSDGRVAAYVELYAAQPATFDDTAVTIEIADHEGSEPLTAAPAQIVPAKAEESRIAHAVVTTRMLPPGRYVARASITRGGKPVGLLVRPFILDAVPAGTAEEGFTVAVPSSMLASIGRFDREMMLKPDVVSAVLDVVQQASPALKDAMAEARAGRYGPAALDALSDGDQPAAMFFRGLDLLTKGQHEQAATQFQNAAGPRREYFPGAFYLGALLAGAGRDQDAAGVWQLGIGKVRRPSFAYAAFADARLRTGQPGSVIDVLEPAFAERPADDQIAKRLAMAYVMTGRYHDAVPVLESYLAKHPADPDALFSMIMAQYEVASRAKVGLSDDQRARLTRYARAYKGPQEALISKYLDALQAR
ncbi:MAG: VWA domain-containing protein [Vicinamibacterales bacterium]